MKRYAIVFCCLMGCLLLGALLGRSYTIRHTAPTVVRDTTIMTQVIHDTSTIVKPVPVADRKLTDSLRILVAMNDRQAYVIDSLLCETSTPPMDTIVEIALPRTQREYNDSTYTAWVSGYEPALDSIAVYNRTVYQTVTIREYQPKKQWTVGIQAGMGVGLSENKVITTPYIGIGLTYKLFEF